MITYIMSSTTMKLFNKFSNNLIKDFITHLESNDIQIPDDIIQSFLFEKPSKRKGRLSPYTIFMKEFRSKYQQDHPEMTFTEISQAMANKWTTIKSDEKKFQEYVTKAAQYNTDIPNNSKKICKATKGSDKQPCQAEAKDGDYCGRHKKLTFDHVDTMENIITSDSDSDYLSCQNDNCTRHAESGPFCSFHSKVEKKTCIKEKANGQTCGKVVKKGDFCGFHNPNKPKKTKKNVEFPIEGALSQKKTVQIVNEALNIDTEKSIRYHDNDYNIYNEPPSVAHKTFIVYNDDPLAYNENGDEIGVIKNNQLQLF